VIKRMLATAAGESASKLAYTENLSRSSIERSNLSSAWQRCEMSYGKHLVLVRFCVRPI
jgi:hypothetical protein